MLLYFRLEAVCAPTFVYTPPSDHDCSVQQLYVLYLAINSAFVFSNNDCSLLISSEILSCSNFSTLIAYSTLTSSAAGKFLLEITGNFTSTSVLEAYGIHSKQDQQIKNNKRSTWHWNNVVQLKNKIWHPWNILESLPISKGKGTVSIDHPAIQRHSSISYAWEGT